MFLNKSSCINFFYKIRILPKKKFLQKKVYQLKSGLMWPTITSEVMKKFDQNQVLNECSPKNLANIFFTRSRRAYSLNNWFANVGLENGIQGKL